MAYSALHTVSCTNLVTADITDKKWSIQQFSDGTFLALFNNSGTNEIEVAHGSADGETWVTQSTGDAPISGELMSWFIDANDKVHIISDSIFDYYYCTVSGTTLTVVHSFSDIDIDTNDSSLTPPAAVWVGGENWTYVSDTSDTDTGVTTFSLFPPADIKLGDLMFCVTSKNTSGGWSADPASASPHSGTLWSQEGDNTGPPRNHRLWKIVDPTDLEADAEYQWTWTGSASIAGTISVFRPPVGGHWSAKFSDSGEILRTDDTTPASTADTHTAGNLVIVTAATVDAPDTGGIGMVTAGYTVAGSPTTGTGSTDVGAMIAYDLDTAGGSITVEADNITSTGDSYVNTTSFDHGTGATAFAYVPFKDTAGPDIATIKVNDGTAPTIPNSNVAMDGVVTWPWTIAGDIMAGLGMIHTGDFKTPLYPGGPIWMVAQRGQESGGDGRGLAYITVGFDGASANDGQVLPGWSDMSTYKDLPEYVTDVTLDAVDYNDVLAIDHFSYFTAWAGDPLTGGINYSRIRQGIGEGQFRIDVAPRDDAADSNDFQLGITRDSTDPTGIQYITGPLWVMGYKRGEDWATARAPFADMPDQPNWASSAHRYMGAATHLTSDGKILGVRGNTGDDTYEIFEVYTVTGTGPGPLWGMGL